MEDDFYINAPSPMIVPGNKYLLAVLDSSLADWYIRQLGVTRNGGYFEYKPMFVEKLPVPIIGETEQQPFSELVDSIILEKRLGKGTTQVEHLIDEQVFELYGLSETEKSYILDNHTL